MAYALCGAMRVDDDNDENSSVWKDEVKILMCMKIGTEFQCLEGKDKNTNVYQNRATIPKFGRRSYFQYLLK